MENLKLMNLEKELLLVSKYDDLADSPREFHDDNSAWNIYTWTRNYQSIDKNPYRDVEDFLLDHFSENHVYNKLWKSDSKGSGWDLEKIITGFANKNMIVEPITKYEHSGISYSRGAGSGWDYGVVGFAVLDKERLKKLRMINRLTGRIVEREKEILDSELETYTQWCNGETYYVMLTDLQENPIDSVGGFYGYGEDKKEILDIASGYFDIGNTDDWEEYNEEKFSEMFETVLVKR